MAVKSFRATDATQFLTINVVVSSGSIDVEVDTGVDLPDNIVFKHHYLRVNSTDGGLPSLDIGRLVGEGGARTDFANNTGVNSTGLSRESDPGVPFTIATGEAVSVTYTWDGNFFLNADFDIIIEYVKLP